MPVLHCLFDLKEGVAEAAFKQEFRAFVGHLEDKGFVVRKRLMRREPHEGFERGRLQQTYYVAIEFPNLALEQACYEYVAADQVDPHASSCHEFEGRAGFHQLLPLLRCLAAKRRLKRKGNAAPQ